jgi:hypothetical protein
MADSAAVSKALEGAHLFWSAEGLLWTGVIVSVLFLVASSVATAASSPFQTTSATAAELVSLKFGSKTTQTGTDTVETVTFTPNLYGGAAGMVVVSVFAVLLVVFFGVGLYVTRAAKNKAAQPV